MVDKHFEFGPPPQIKGTTKLAMKTVTKNVSLVSQPHSDPDMQSRGQIATISHISTS